MEDKKGFNKAETEAGPAKKFFSALGLVVLSLALAVFTVVVINV
ncbi:MAG: hypothetical protein SPL13_04030 [Clostridia bacterium]|nr:hypothetical protein [Clostridia bacterium]